MQRQIARREDRISFDYDGAQYEGGFFFGAHLWEEVDAGADPAKRARARQDWRKLPIDAAREVFMRALEEPPQTSARRYRAVAEAETVFKAGLRRHFPQLAAEGKEVADV